MSFKPRWYQAESVRQTLDYYWGGGTEDGIICIPTAGGKSYTQCMIVQEILEKLPETRIMMLTHVKELVGQNYKSMKAMWPQAPAGVYSAGLNKRETNKRITFGGIMSVARRVAEFGKIGLVMIDECHLVSDKDSATYRKVIAELRETNPHLKVIGLTATPYRLGMGSLLEGGLFSKMLYTCCDFDSINRLIDEGYLSNLVTKRVSAGVDRSSLKMRGGEFTHASAEEAINLDAVTESALDEVERQAFERKHWMIFAQSIEHAESIHQKLNNRGHACVVVHSKMTSTERDKAIIDFKTGKVRALVNMGVLTTGFDFPALDCLVILRLTQSTSLWVQMLGRGMRIHPSKKDCLVLDFAGNAARLGAINDPVIPTAKGTSDGTGVAPVKVCPDCDTYLNASARTCPECGLTFERAVNILATAAVEELVVRKRDAWHKVIGVHYGRHNKQGKPPSVKVSYNIGAASVVAEYVCIEHGGWQARKAAEWVQERLPFGWDMPTTTEDLLLMADMLRKPTFITTERNGNYRNVKKVRFGIDDPSAPF